jgi:hypothetical protein
MSESYSVRFYRFKFHSPGDTLNFRLCAYVNWALWCVSMAGSLYGPKRLVEVFENE